MSGEPTGGDRPAAMPPVRLSSESELARDALAAPLFQWAARLAVWAGAEGGTGGGTGGVGGEGAEGVPVGAGGELLAPQLKEAVAHLGLSDDEDGEMHTAQAWQLAVDVGLLDVEDDEAAGADEADGDGAAGGEAGDAEGGADGGPDEGGGDGGGDGGTAGQAPSLTEEPVGTARPGPELALLRGEGAPGDVLEIWQGGMESVLADAATPSFEDLIGGLEDVTGEDGQIDPEAIDLDSLDWNPEQEADFLDGALGNLYVLTATDQAVSAGAMVPLPVLAASMIVPDDMEEPTDAVLEEVSAAMMKLDEQFRMLAPTGLVEYQPVDEALTEETDEDVELPETPDDEDVSRYGMVRLTPLGIHGVRVRLLEAGAEAPAVGDLADADAEKLLGALIAYTEENAQAEIESWLAARTPLRSARELLSAARGTDEDAPSRRLACQQALSLIGTDAEPALRDVLEDRQLGGLARVWLVEHGATDVPQPDEEMVFWLTVDTIAAQLATAGEADELRELVRGLVDQHAGFFDKAWKVDHPATGHVLEAMGRVHPDKQTAKDARKAAFKARSRLN
ncbi:hypothetical protein HCC61_19000 [Streptomyces sp. HNM0575]|uniref:hypothetical protein n=1 Tax=Streptomyces sp. HNM0575 TaxID=2716338 RepID=UPI00145F6C1F|nr:hypothetical protein [Streptomyces sp. HNM0575]NLU74739.1 hypothetical protein [Streptomyces sp. HNM0575]